MPYQWVVILWFSCCLSLMVQVLVSTGDITKTYDHPKYPKTSALIGQGPSVPVPLSLVFLKLTSGTPPTRPRASATTKDRQQHQKNLTTPIAN